MRITGVLLLALVCAAVAARAEVPGKSPEDLQTIATHVIHGKVVMVFERKAKYGYTIETRYVAEVQVNEVVKGEGLKAGDLVYVRYWDKAYSPPPQTDPNVPPPAGAGGHWDLPKEGATLRIYLAKNAHDGYEDTTDGGYNVVGPNGFAALPAGR